MTDLEKLTDEALVRRIRDGDTEAFRVLSERYTHRLRRHIEGQLSAGMKRRVAASDILQEAHLVALQNYGDFEDRGGGSFGRWFGKIVDNKIHEAVRRHVQAEKRSIAQEVTRAGRRETRHFAANAHSPSQLAIGEELRGAARDAIEELPPHYREVLELLQEQQLTTREAAARLNLSRDAVRQLYSRALARVEQALGLAQGARGGRRRPTR